MVNTNHVLRIRRRVKTTSIALSRPLHAHLYENNTYIPHNKIVFDLAEQRRNA